VHRSNARTFVHRGAVIGLISLIAVAVLIAAIKVSQGLRSMLIAIETYHYVKLSCETPVIVSSWGSNTQLENKIHNELLFRRHGNQMKSNVGRFKIDVQNQHDI
jgi:hypothetical protein